VNTFLDDAAARAIQPWRFERVIRGLQAVGVSFDWSIDFDPERWLGVAVPDEANLSESYSPEFKQVLALASGYCDRLGAAILDFFGRESMRSLDCGSIFRRQWRHRLPV